MNDMKYIRIIVLLISDLQIKDVKTLEKNINNNKTLYIAKLSVHESRVDSFNSSSSKLCLYPCSLLTTLERRRRGEASRIYSKPQSNQSQALKSS